MIQTKFLCKKDGVDVDHFTFIRDKWYDGGWKWIFTSQSGIPIRKKYWVINEQGKDVILSIFEMKDLFYMRLNEVIDKQIDEILK